MKIRRVQIHNFRAILDATFEVQDYALLVGANNSGKTTALDAIRAFYEKDGFKFKQSDLPHMAGEDKDSWIEITFELNEAEYQSLAEPYQVTPNALKVRKYFNTAAKGSDGKSAAGLIYAYKADGTLSSESFYGAKNVQSGKFGDLIYIPAISKVDEHAKLSGPSALRDLLTDILSDVVAAGTSYPEFVKSVEKFSGQIGKEKTKDERSLDGFAGELSEMLKPWDASFKLRFPPPSAAEIIKSMLAWDVIDHAHGQSQGVDSYGSGFQRHFIYSLIQLATKYAGSKTAKKAKDFAPAMNLVLFEEPEAFLHPPQQEILARSLKSLAASDNWQVICATHSAHFVSKNADDIPSIARLRRTAGVSTLNQIDSAKWSAIANANQAIAAIAAKYPKLKMHADDTKHDMEAVKHFLWLNPDRSSVFFANQVLLVEGPTEVALVNRLIGQGKISGGDRGVYVLDCLGKYNIHRFMNLLSALGVPHSVIHDDDHNKDEHAELNQLVMDSINPAVTRAVCPITGDLEEFLGITPTGKHRKPQHVLYQLDTGAIAADRLQAFCALVDTALPLQ